MSNSSTTQRYPSWSAAGRGSPRCTRRRIGAIAADAVVLTTELPDTYRLLGRTPRRLLTLRPAPSAVVAHVGCRAVDDRASGTTRSCSVTPGTRPSATSSTTGASMGDPSLLVTRPTAGDPSLAPPGRDLLYILAPAPNTEVGGSIGTPPRRPTPTQMLGAVTDAAARTRRRSRAAARRRPGRLGAPGHGCGHPVRAGAHVRPDRTVPAGQHRARRRQRGAGRFLTVPGVGVPTALHVRAAGRRPDHRSRRTRPARSTRWCQR